MKKSRMFLIASSMVVFSMFATAIESFALRVLNYEFVCVGSGGTCLDSVVITAPKIK